MASIRRQLLAMLVLASSCTALVGTAPAQAATLGCADDARGTTDLSAWVPPMLTATNAHRATLGLAPLQLDATLAKAATWKARDLAARNYFAHDDPAGSDGSPARTPWERLAACGYTADGARAENIAAGQDSGAAFVAAWIASPGHRANIENGALRYVGFGVASLSSSTYGTYAVQMFASLPGPLDPVRDPLEGGEDTASRIVGGATITRHQCRSRLAVRGWCYLLTTRGRLVSTDASTICWRGIAVARRTPAGRFVPAGAARTRLDGSFVTRAYLQPPVRGTTTWLLLTARAVRITAGATAAVPASTVTIRARVLL